MLFKNLKTGNTVAAANETSIELMQRSSIYETVKPTTPTPETATRDTETGKPVKKTAE